MTMTSIINCESYLDIWQYAMIQYATRAIKFRQSLHYNGHGIRELVTQLGELAWQR